MHSHLLECSLTLVITISVLPRIAPSQTLPSEVPLKTTLCEIEADPSRFAGRRVEVRTTLAGNFEMSLLTDPSCPHPEVLVWFGAGLVETNHTQYAFIDSVESLSRPNSIPWQPWPPINFHRTKESDKMSRYIRKHEKKYGDATITATFIGRLGYIPRTKLLALKSADGKVWATSAFGHQRCCQARLLPEDIRNIVIPER